MVSCTLMMLRLYREIDLQSDGARIGLVDRELGSPGQPERGCGAGGFWDNAAEYNARIRVKRAVVNAGAVTPS